jgi:hypothetical protein
MYIGTGTIIYGPLNIIGVQSNMLGKSTILFLYKSGVAVFAFSTPCFVNPWKGCAQQQPECKLESCSFLAAYGPGVFLLHGV